MNEHSSPIRNPIALGEIAALFAGMLFALCTQGSSALSSHALLLLLRPLTLLGELLRTWSLSGSFGNAAAWTALAVLSLLPIGFVLIRRRKCPLKSDLLALPIGTGIFVCLYLLVNPTLVMHPMSGASGDLPQGLAPALTLLSLLTAFVLIRCAQRIDRSSPLKTLLTGMKLLLRIIIVLTAASAGYVLTKSILSISLSAPALYIPAPSLNRNGMAELLLCVISLIPDFLLIITLRRAVLLCDAFGESSFCFSGFSFHPDTERCADNLSRWAKYTLTASLLCMALSNFAAMLLGSVLVNQSLSLTFPLIEAAFSCGAMLLSRCIASACRIQRENDLII